MNDNPDERAIELGKYIAKTGSTVRQAAAAHSVSKSTVHSDITKRLCKINPELYEKVRLVLNKNKSLRHIRGGMATKEKYLKIGKEHTYII